VRLINYQNDPRGLIGQQAQFANSAAPAAATLSNTTPSYTTLGGKFNFAIPVTGAETDFALFGFQVPVNVGQLMVQGISISLAVSVVIGAAPVLFEWGVGINSTAASLATVDNAATGVFGPRRQALGSHGFAAAAPVGTVALDLAKLFNSWLVVENQRFFHVICRIPTAAGAAPGSVRGSVLVDGFFGG
jgi:hypothetical protein